MAEKRQTALGIARARFVEGLPKKAREVKASLALLAGSPDAERPRDELRRRLHALYASAQVFRIGPLADALKDAIASIDSVRIQGREFMQDELDELANLAATLPGMGVDADPSPPSHAAPPPVQASRPPKPSPRTNQGLETVVSVLVVDDPQWQARVRAALPPERFELLYATDPDEALRLARSAAPDVVLADRATVLKPGVDLIGRLREDPLTDFVPVVLLLPPGSPLDPIAVREAGADEALVKPFNAERLLKTVARVTDTLAGAKGASTLTGDLTVEEIADRIADEVKRGLVDAAAQGRELEIPLGDGTPLMAAAWSAIGRVRAHLAEKSGGRVRFREGPQRGGPAFVTVGGEDALDEELEAVDLAGRRALVVDDDPAVVWFFAGLLREQGAEVNEADDGIEALEMARRKRPDLIISDILMPRLDGFGLTRALKRDPVLADVPVILLSWKEDFLQRMRQLKAGASGYLRKEAASAQILNAVREVLRPRARLESRLRAGGEVRGRLEDVGVQTLIQTVATHRPNARLTVRDASSLYECDLRESELLDVSRTESDGSFKRGERMLMGLLGATTGRYTVVDDDGPVRESIDKPLEEALEENLTEIASRVDAVSGKNLSKAVTVELDEEVLNNVMRNSPEELGRVVDPLRSGRGPRELLLSGDVEPGVLEQFLVDLARQGAIRRVLGPDREDRIALAREARGKGLHPALTEHDEGGTLSWLPTEETTKEIVLSAERMAAQAADREDELEFSDMELESLRPPPVPREADALLDQLAPPPEEPATSPVPSAPVSSLPVLDEPFHPESDAPLGLETAETTEYRIDGLRDDELETQELTVRDGDELETQELTLTDEAQAPTDDDDDDEPMLLLVDDEEEDDEEAAGDENPDDEEDDDGPELLIEEQTPDDAEDDDAEDDDAEDDDAEDDDAEDDDAEDDDAEDDDAEDDDAEDDDAEDDDAEDDEEDDEEAPALRVPEPPALVAADDEPEEIPAPAPLRSIPPPESVEPREPEPADGSMGWVAWALVLVICAAAGFVGYRWMFSDPPVEPETTGPIAPDPDLAPDPDPAPMPDPDPGQADPTPDPDPDPAPTADDSLPVPYGREEASIASVGVVVGDGQGLLVLEPGPDRASMRVQVAEREIQLAGQSIGVALDEGVHHLTFIRGDHQDFVWVVVRAGRTRYAPPLP